MAGSVFLDVSVISLQRNMPCPEVDKLAPHVDAVLLTQFSMASALSHLQTTASVPVLSAPHSSARRLKQVLSVSI